MIKLALIGLGAWGKNYVSTVKLLKDCRIKYLCAASKDTLQAFQGDYIKTTNYKDLLSYKDIDGIIIATPSKTHYRISKEFIGKGFNLLIEKPLVENYYESVKLHFLQKKSKSKVLIGHTYLFDPAYIKTKELVKSIGKIRYIAYVGTNNGPYRENTSALWDLGPHAISLCLDVYQKVPVQISAWALDSLNPNRGFFDFSFIKLKFLDKTEAYIKISWLFPMKKRELIIVGTKDTIEYDADADRKIIYYKNMIDTLKQKKKIKNYTKISYPKYDLATPLETELREFINVIKYNKKNFYSDLDFGMQVTKIIESAIKSIKSNGLPIDIINRENMN